MTLRRVIEERVSSPFTHGLGVQSITPPGYRPTSEDVRVISLIAMLLARGYVHRSDRGGPTQLHYELFRGSWVVMIRLDTEGDSVAGRYLEQRDPDTEGCGAHTGTVVAGVHRGRSTRRSELAGIADSLGRPCRRKPWPAEGFK